MTWAIGEQNVATEVFAGDHHPHLVGLQFSSSDAVAQLCTLTLRCEDGSSYQLEFNRGGTFASATKVEAPSDVPPQPGGEDAGEKEAGTRSASSKKSSRY